MTADDSTSKDTELENIVENETVLDTGLENIKGIGPKTKQKLVDRGIDSVLGLAVALPSELDEALGGAEDSANPLIVMPAKALISFSG